MQTSFEKAVQIALENGYNRDRYISREHALLDREFFIALGKGLGWSVERKNYATYYHPLSTFTVHGNEADFHWHRFIDHLAEEKDIDSFFADLINPSELK